MSKRTLHGLTFVLLGMAMALLLQGHPARALAAEPARPASATTLVADGAVLTQTFTLHGGWNTIYLEVNPLNTSLLVDPDGDGPLPAAPSMSTLEAVFAGLSCADCLESVWTWNVPVSRADFIVNPNEGLWDQPGWKRYFTAQSVGPDGESQAFLTNLLTLYANTAYLVKLSDDFVGEATLTVSGRPVVSGRRWVKDSYNLSGFPLQPGATPTVQSFLSASPLTEIYRLSKDGKWETLAPTDTLAYGEGYLVFFDASSSAPENFAAPVGLTGLLSDGLAFSSGMGKRSDSFQVQNLTTQSLMLNISLLDGADADVALRLTAPVAAQLRTQPAQVTIAAGGAAQLDFALLSTEQPD
ncbi:MAG: hypothetical protein KDD84_24765, partial [Caldilineaceae bacterium]|nr:hypothetical protein [Caldilineaceae bacterium]